MKNIVIVLLLLGLVGCTLRKDVVYVQDIDEAKLAVIDSIFSHPKIEINDILSIQLSAMDQSSLIPFVGQNTEATGTNGYLVRTDGTINFPVLGTIKVAGLSSIDVQESLQDSLSQYIVDPIVRVNISNFKFTILGSITRPGTYQIEEEAINIIQAIGLAGDFDISGKRHNVLLVRQENGVRSSYRFDFTKSDWMNSPYYFLKQNDIIYIEPNFARVKSGGLVGDLTELLRVATVAISTYVLFTR